MQDVLVSRIRSIGQFYDTLLFPCRWWPFVPLQMCPLHRRFLGVGVVELAVSFLAIGLAATFLVLGFVLVVAKRSSQRNYFPDADRHLTAFWAGYYHSSF